MKITRQNISEEYSTTVDWLNDFANNLEKNADYLSNLRSIMKKRNDFPTIEEKMADMKIRSGFDFIKDIDMKEEGNIKSAGCGDTCCDEEAGKGKCGSCGSNHGHSKETLQILRNIINHIKGFVSTRAEEDEEVSYGAVLTYCREQAPIDLKFNETERKIDHKKFQAVIENILAKHKNDPEESNIGAYTSEADVASSYDDDIADYISHAQTG
jgi:hypothetical protein